LLGWCQNIGGAIQNLDIEIPTIGENGSEGKWDGLKFQGS
jgi:hypothetical protein